MNQIQQFVGMLLSAAIHNRKISKVDEVSDWYEIFRLAGEHQIQSLLYSVVKDISTENGGPNDELMHLWKNTSLLSAVVQNNNYNNVCKVLSSFNEADIPFIALKGFIIRDLYPKPELRTMSDLDILVRDKYIESAKSVLERFGYVEEDRSYKHIQFFHDDQLAIELHTRLLDEQFLDNTERWEKTLWDNAVSININNIPILTLSIEDHLLFLFFHLIVHFMLSGFGLRQLYDLAVFIKTKREQIDWVSFYNKVIELRINNFVSLITSVCEEIFDIKMPEIVSLRVEDEHNINIIINDIFAGGVFGYNETGHIISGVLTNFIGEKKILPSRFIRIIYVLFPPYRIMKQKYKYIRKLPILMPIAWLHRFFYNLIRKDKLFSKKSDYLNIFSSHKVYEERYKLLQWLDMTGN